MPRFAQQPNERVAEDCVSQVTDVRGFVWIDAGVLNQHLVFLLSFRRARKHLPHKGAAIEPGIDVSGSCDLEFRETRNGTKLCNQLLCLFPRRFPQLLGQFEGKWKGVLTKSNLRRLLDDDVRQIEIIFFAQDRAYTFAE